MSKPEAQKTYRQGFEDVPGSGKEHLADPLSTVDVKNLHARARIPAVFSMATHNLVAAAVRKEKSYTNNQGVEFNMGTLSGRMSCWDFEYEAISISKDGKGREEVAKVLSLAAIGGSDESGAIAASVLNEGSKQMGTGKSSKTS